MTAHQGEFTRSLMSGGAPHNMHTDVVPVEPATVDDWINPPYSGFYDGRYLQTAPVHLVDSLITGEWIWGRGTCDDKADVIASL